MNDWHHWGAIEEDPNRPGLPANLYLYSSPFYEEHPEYLIGADGVAGYQGDSPRGAMPYLQDFAHEEVRDSRIEVMVEACERYDVAGFHYDFMRIPGYFKIGQEHASAPLMTDLIRRSRRELDRIGQARGKPIGFAVRWWVTLNFFSGTAREAPAPALPVRRTACRLPRTSVRAASQRPRRSALLPRSSLDPSNKPLQLDERPIVLRHTVERFLDSVETRELHHLR